MLGNPLDHVREGRIGWNCVTGSNDGAAQNDGRDRLLPHDERYHVAHEFADVVTRLWEAWEPDAAMLDCDTPVFADGTKGHSIHREGTYFKVRGPPNAPRAPPARQAGSEKFPERELSTVSRLPASTSPARPIA